MKAILRTVYGLPHLLELGEIERPLPNNNELLIKVHAASVNPGDSYMVRGRPFLIRAMAGGLRRPTKLLIGEDVAGVVEAVGSDVTAFKVGDRVMGDMADDGTRAFAEYTTLREGSLHTIPDSMTFEDAATIPLAGSLAVQGLIDDGRIQVGHRVLINGAGGGAGTFAVQVATALGAEVTGVDSGEKLELIRSLGADYTIDYRSTDFTRNGEQYDLIFDVAAFRSISDYKRSLTPQGRYVMVGGSLARAAQGAILGRIISEKYGRRLMIQKWVPGIGIERMIEMVVEGKVRCVIDQLYPLAEVGVALQRLDDFGVVGKLVISIATGNGEA